MWKLDSSFLQVTRLFVHASLGKKLLTFVCEGHASDSLHVDVRRTIRRVNVPRCGDRPHKRALRRVTSPFRARELRRHHGEGSRMEFA